MISMPKSLNSVSDGEMKNFLDSFDTVLCDCDGVLWLENEVIENSQHTVNKFIEKNKNFYYVTNNNSKTREEYAEKCVKLGFNADKENIICTAYLAADYLKSINFSKKVYIIGSAGIVKELDKVGIKHTDIGPDVIQTTLESYIKKNLELDPEIGAVLIGFDQHFSYPKMVKAATYLRDPDCLFLATCPDESFPVSSQLVLPGTGCVVKCLEAASGRKAFILGKPNDYIKNAILRMQNIKPERTLMIGDRFVNPSILSFAVHQHLYEGDDMFWGTNVQCNTDILFGKRCGFQTLLVMTGVTSLRDVENFAKSNSPDENALVPQYFVNKLGDLLPHLS